MKIDKLDIDNLQRITLARNFNSYPYFTLGCSGDIGLYTATIKFEELERIFNAAFYDYKKGIKNDHTEVSCENNPQLAQDWIRFHYLKNAILSYNSCYDYILQIVYFAYDFNGDVGSNEEYVENLGKCKFSDNSRFYKRFGELSVNNPDAKKLLSALKDFYYSDKQLRDWANTLKHRGNLCVENLITRKYNFSVINSYYKTEFSSRFVQPEIVTLDDIIMELFKQHSKIFDFTNYLYDFIGFNNAHINPIKGLLSLPKQFTAR